MQIKIVKSPNFCRRLKNSEESEYSDVLNRARQAVAGGSGKNVLIVPTSSLPQMTSNNTGVGGLGTDDGLKFFDFAKKYWGINEVQILPSGQYHYHNGHYAMYSGTGMDLGNHLIDIKSFLPKEDFDEIVKQNKISERVNFANIVDTNSPQEKALKILHRQIPIDLKKEFEQYKLKQNKTIEQKGLYKALCEIYGTPNFKHWNNLDRNLFDEDLVKLSDREKRIKEIYVQKSELIDFYKFKQFLAEKSMKTAREKLNSKGIKLSGDMICGFSYDEVWANQKAFIKDGTIGWGLPALNLDTKEAEALLREKVRFYAEHFDGIRVDAAWSYVSPKVTNKHDSNILISHKNYGDKFLNIIEEEVQKIKGASFDKKNIMYEFVADSNVFSSFDGTSLKPFLRDRMKIYTSDHLSEDWGGAEAYVRRGWSRDSFMVGAMNHDSKEMITSEAQIKALSEFLRIPTEKLKSSKEFIKAKFAEPLRSKHNFLFFMPALGINGRFKDNRERLQNYTAKISENYEEIYHKNLQSGEAFNPMDALEKQFIAQELDKTEPELYKKIVKYRKILQQKEGTHSKILEIALGISCISVLIFGIYKLLQSKRDIKNYS